MRRPPAFAVVASAVATVATALSLVVSAPARADQPAPANRPAPGVLMTTDEQDCHEVTYVRAAKLAAVQALLGPHWTAWEARPGVVPFYIDDYVCERTTVDGIPVSRRTVTSFALVDAVREGDGTRRLYLLWWGTDNPLVFSRMHRAGLPVELIPRSTATLTTDGATTTVRYDIVGGGLTHVLSVSEPAVPPGALQYDPAGDFGYWYETATGDVRLAYSNLAYPPFGGTLSGDFTRSTRIDQLFLDTGTRTPTGVTISTAFVGSWTGVLYAPTG